MVLQANQVMQESQDITQVIIDLNNRVRSLEGKYNLQSERLLIVNQNLIEEYKRVMKEIKIINDDLQEVKRETFMIQDALRNIVKEMEVFAKKEQIKTLEKYIDLLNPMRFVTDEEVKNIVVEEIKRKKHAR